MTNQPPEEEVTIHAKCSMHTRSSRFHLRALLSPKSKTRYDIFSIKMQAGLPCNLKGVEIRCGGATILAFDINMLRQLEVEDNQLEILQPFIPYLPLSKLQFHEVDVYWTFSDTQLPPTSIRVRKKLPSLKIPIYQPVASVPDGLKDLAVLTPNIMPMIPNELIVGRGLMGLCRSYSTHLTG